MQRIAALHKRFARPIRLASRAIVRYRAAMDFDQLLIRFFGTAEIAELPPERLMDGVAALRVQFGLERDGGRRFALWCLMFMLGVAPEVTDAFADEADRDAARDFMEEAEAGFAEEE